jgi:hypothetical protein
VNNHNPPGTIANFSPGGDPDACVVTMNRQPNDRQMQREVSATRPGDDDTAIIVR